MQEANLSYIFDLSTVQAKPFDTTGPSYYGKELESNERVYVI